MIEDLINQVYGSMDGAEDVEVFCARHGIQSFGILTVASPHAAKIESEKLADRVRNKIVVEIGAGVGLLSCQIAASAKQVFAIEADPAWTWVFVEALYRHKPANLTWIFGRAEEMVGLIRADVAIVYTRSDIRGMLRLAAKFAPTVIQGPLTEFAKRYADVPAEDMLAASLIADMIIADINHASASRKRKKGKAA